MLGRSRARWARAVDRLGLAFLLTLLLTSPAGAQESVAGNTSAVVYDTDDRVEYYEIPGTTFPAIARGSIVAMVPTNDIDIGGSGQPFPPFVATTITVDELVMQQFHKPLCAGERFAGQPSASICSGTLIDDDLVLTAGHCAPDRAFVRSFSWVFDYHYVADGVRESIDASDVYAGAELLVHSEQSSPLLDYAVVQLDRPVVGRSPADIRRDATALAVGTGVNVLGFGMGLPLKFDAGGTILNDHATRLDTFITNSDTFEGNSGAGVFDDAGVLIGILVTGAQDYDTSGTCATVSVLSGLAAAEANTYAFRPLDALCATGFPTPLCPGNPAPSCGDHYCSGGEDDASCPGDCASPHCADGTCSSNESITSCPIDCTSTPLKRHHGRCSVSTASASSEGASEGAFLFLLCATTLVARRRARNR